MTRRYVVKRMTQPGGPYAALTPRTADYWQARQWVAAFLKAARAVGLQVRPYLVWPEDPESRIPNRWMLFDRGEWVETVGLEKEDEAARSRPAPAPRG